MANKRDLLKEFGPKIIEVYGPDELKFLKENFSGDELEKYIKIDHDSFKGYKTSKLAKSKRMTKARAGKTMTPKQKKFAALAPPRNKITYADKIAGATKGKAKRGKTKVRKAKNGLTAAVKKIKADKGKTVFSDRLKAFQKQTSMKMKSPKLVRMKPLAAQTSKRRGR
tara:strand:+ start:51 stop:554 length:504 start_codon:yes stop_codon:yes gene_type:complete